MPFGVEIPVADSGTNGNASNWARQGSLLGACVRDP